MVYSGALCASNVGVGNGRKFMFGNSTIGNEPYFWCWYMGGRKSPER